MKKLALVLFFISSFTFAMNSLPNGKWSGKGKWFSQDGKTGKYKLALVIKKNTIKSIMNFEGETKETVEKFIFTKNGFFTIQNKNEEVMGNGYCFRRACHYELKANEKEKMGAMELSFRFGKRGKIRAIGSSTHEGKRFYFVERLRRRK